MWESFSNYVAEKKFLRENYLAGCQLVGNQMSNTLFAVSRFSSFFGIDKTNAILQQIIGDSLGLGIYLKSYSYASQKLDAIENFIKENKGKVFTVLALGTGIGTIYVCVTPGAGKKILELAKQKSLECAKSYLQNPKTIWSLRQIIMNKTEEGISYIFYK